MPRTVARPNPHLRVCYYWVFPFNEVSVDRLTRKELKSDRFALEVQHSVEYIGEHRRQVVRWGSIALGVAILIFAGILYRNRERSIRQEALHDAMLVLNANVGSGGNEFNLMFPTAAARDAAVDKAFTNLAAKYPGTDEGNIAQYVLGSIAADKGNVAEAEKRFKMVVDTSNSYAALAKVSLATIYGSNNKRADGEKLLQSLIDHPTELVSKEAATIELAHLIAKSDPQRARKLLEPLRGSPRPTVSKAALSALSEIPQK